MRRDPFSIIEHKKDLTHGTLALEKDRCGFSFHAPEGQLSEEHAGEMVWRKAVDFWSLPMNELTIRVPRTPWQMFKHLYFPVWLLRRLPARCHVTVYTVRMCFPESATEVEQILRERYGKPIPLFRREEMLDE